VSQAQPLIELKNVTRAYNVGTRMLYALRDVSVQIFPGEFTAVLGPSGSGKSTLLHLVAGIDKPTSGEVWVAGRRIDQLDENTLAKWRRDHVGIVFQFFQLLPTLTALENVTLPLELRGASLKPNGSGGRDGFRRRSQEALTRVGLAERASQLPSELSGGEQQRVAIARALINDPPILRTDEPTGNLDGATALSIISLLSELAASGKTIMLITHEEDFARATHRIIRMRDGRIEA